ncbi:hypothetical protein LTSEMIS_5168, partial [Salmonella enterica subsp. enterica serovar Mississippi str. A4-633]
MNRPTLFFADLAFHVDRFAQDVHDTTQRSLPPPSCC